MNVNITGYVCLGFGRERGDICSLFVIFVFEDFWSFRFFFCIGFGLGLGSSEGLWMALVCFVKFVVSFLVVFFFVVMWFIVK